MNNLLERLDRHVPLRRELSPDWDDVLARAHADRHRRRRPRFVVALVAAVALAAAAVVAFWPTSHRGILDRARAAVGTDPVVHVVFRDEVNETLVDLRTGRRTPLYEEHEQWFDPARGLREVVRFNGVVQWEHVYEPGRLPPQAKETYAGLFDGYRRALDDGTATLRGDGTVNGRSVFWVHLTGEQLLDSGDERYHEWTHEIAVDARSYLPVYVREARDGVPAPGTGQEILTVETLPSGAADFTPTPPEKQRAAFLGVSDRVDITTDGPNEARAALGTTPVWLGTSYAGLPLARVEQQRLRWGPVEAPEDGVGIELCYGRLGPGMVGTTLTQAACDVNAPHVLVQESREANDVYAWNRGGRVAIPHGSALLGWGGRNVFLVREGVYVHIAADSEDAVLAAARALQSWR
jgi:hypothetical protein